MQKDRVHVFGADLGLDLYFKSWLPSSLSLPAGAYAKLVDVIFHAVDPRLFASQTDRDQPVLGIQAVAHKIIVVHAVLEKFDHLRAGIIGIVPGRPCEHIDKQIGTFLDVLMGKFYDVQSGPPVFFPLYHTSRRAGTARGRLLRGNCAAVLPGDTFPQSPARPRPLRQAREQNEPLPRDSARAGRTPAL